jgi:asparagine synthase (glutamine-hydrolysing)
VSGFVGILHVNGRPLDRSLLECLTKFQRFRGPDGQNVWLGGAIGLGHTLLKTCPESERDCQPLSLDGRSWIVADCRVDARPALIAELASRGHHDLAQAPDVELILRAYAVWRDDCVHHLLGDFSFAIWDDAHQRLFCARDQMGVKPFYYAYVDSSLIFSNTLTSIRQHPAVSGDLNELSIADFLLFDLIQDAGATSFRDIHRLPPAHTLTVARESVLVRRYWTLPVSEPLRHARDSDCVEQFQELMDAAVADRLRTNSAAVMMSGGLDSATVAASAQKMFARDGNPSGLRAYTEVFDRLIPHEERRYAGLVAEALKIPIQFQNNDDLIPCKCSGLRETGFPEPVHSPWDESGPSLLSEVAATRRVALTGFGGDPALSCLLTAHFLKLLKGRHFGRVMADVARYLAAEGRFSRLYLRTRWRRWFPSRNVVAHYPGWLNPDFEKRLDLRQRWETLNRDLTPASGVRPMALEATLSSSWPALFEQYDSGVTGIPIEVRHPFFDLRLVSFLLALPALPWCSDKELLRQASRDVLPDAVRLRRKSPLVADPLIAALQRPESEWLDSFNPCVDLTRFVQRSRIPKVRRERSSWSAWINLRPLSLNFWLRAKRPSGITN